MKELIEKFESAIPLEKAKQICKKNQRWGYSSLCYDGVVLYYFDGDYFIGQQVHKKVMYKL